MASNSTRTTSPSLLAGLAPIVNLGNRGNRRSAASFTLALAAIMAVSGCALERHDRTDAESPRIGETRETRHDGDDDLLTAGLGIDGLRRPPELPADRDHPSAAELRRLALHSNFNGLVDLTATGGFGPDVDLPRVPGREFHAFIRLPGREQPARLMVQVPDQLDTSAPCLLVAPASGSRGVYGAVPVAGVWGLARGCAVAYTDKGAGTDLFDHASGTGVALDGTRAEAGETVLGHEPGPVPLPLVSVPHAHSKDNPEADWGHYTVEAARFGLDVLEQVLSVEQSSTDSSSRADDRIRVIAVGLSNGGGAVLRGIERAPEGLFDAAIVAAPNVSVPGAPHLYDYATRAALFQPCLLADPTIVTELPFGNAALVEPAFQRCEALADAGLIDQPNAEAAREVLTRAGFDDAALEQAAVNTMLDLWRSVAAMYASAYLQTGADQMPCGFSTAIVDADGKPVAASSAQRNQWWALSSGVVPGGGLELINPKLGGPETDPAFESLACLRQLWTADRPSAWMLREAVEATRASGRVPDIPVLVIHGRQDGLIPPGLTSVPYVETARGHGAESIAYWEIDGAQHFDVLVPFPGMSTRYRPLLPFLSDGLDHLEAVLDQERPLGDDRVIEAIDPR